MCSQHFFLARFSISSTGAPIPIKKGRPTSILRSRISWRTYLGQRVVFSFLQCAFFSALFPSVSFRQFLGGPRLVNPTRQYCVTQLYHLGMEEPRPCFVCATATKLTCGCKKANYCSSQCQKADWHQFLCYAWKFKGCIPRSKSRSEKMN